MDHYAAETRQDKVSLSIVPKLCGGHVWVESFLQCFDSKIGWIHILEKLWCNVLGLESRRIWHFKGEHRMKTSWTFSMIEKKKESFTFFRIHCPKTGINISAGVTVQRAIGFACIYAQN